MTVTPANRTLAAAGAIGIYAVLIGYTDNYVRVIAAEAGLWQFHAVRTAMALVLVALVALPFGWRVRPRSWRAVIARSLVHGAAMLVYFGCLAVLPVAQVAAGLFTAPIFVLLFSRFVFGHALGPARIFAVALGFVGVLLVLGPGQNAPITVVSLLPIGAGALYALGNIATREWCAQEGALTLTTGFFVALGLFGLIGMAVLALWPQPDVAGRAGFVLRGAIWPTGTFMFWTFVQALGSLIAVGAMVRGYQLADAGRVAVFEYAVLPAAALWGWAIWAEVLGTREIVGMVLVFAAGAVIALRGR